MQSKKTCWIQKIIGVLWNAWKGESLSDCFNKCEGSVEWDRDKDEKRDNDYAR